MSSCEMLFFSSYRVWLPDVPVCQGPDGIRYDFNDGARILLPEGSWHVRIEDSDTGNIIDELDSGGGLVQSSIRYYVRFRIKVWKKGESFPVWEHSLNLKGRETQILFPLSSLGDCIAWISSALEFVKRHSCKAEFIMSRQMSELFCQIDREIRYTDPRVSSPLFSKPYASYHLGLIFQDNSYSKLHSPSDYRLQPLHCQAAGILGVNKNLIPLNIKSGKPRPIQERYVAISCKSGKKAKNWINPKGWVHTVAYLRRIGYRVVCIDKKAMEHGQGLPPGAEDMTGDLPISERAAVIEHSDFLIGLDSFLSWLAWALGKKVIVIGGYTLPFHIFSTPYRIMVPYSCNGCFHDLNVPILETVFDYDSCPRHKGTDREYECGRLITAKQVIMQINRLMSDCGLDCPRGNAHYSGQNN